MNDAVLVADAEDGVGTPLIVQHRLTGSERRAAKLFNLGLVCDGVGGDGCVAGD